MRRWLSAVIASLLLLFSALPLRAQARAVQAADTLALSLEKSVALALANNTDLKIAEEKVVEARSRVAEALAAFFPQFTGSASYTRLDMAPYIPTSRFTSLFGALGGGLPAAPIPTKITIGLPDNYATWLKLQQPLFTGGKIRNAHAMSSLAERGAESDVDRMTADLVFAVKRAYLSCVKARTLETVATESLQRIEAHMNDLEAMYQAGLAVNNDVLKTKVYHAQARLDLMKAQNAERLAQKELCNIVGLPLESAIAFTTTVDEVSPVQTNLDDAVRTGIERRPELKTLGLQKSIARADVAASRGGYLPDVFFFANLGYQYPDREYARDFYTSWNLGVMAQMSIFDWGAVASRVRESRSRFRQVEIAEAGARNDVALDVTRSYLTLVEAWNEIDVAREGVAQAEENYRVTDERFKEGLATNTDLLDAQVLLTKAKTTYGNAKVDYMIAQADMARALGAPAP
jgi:outer membrane protein